ncbi:unnamed protein product [Vitrella brassicaformis CCMP3155]|uniref:Sugar phosphate transporter domain-containing protein n=2 Tax=Vitrella brassicaformis TaxID=1169539 RepID=A0A0G4H5K4_VITBC|nr:unnamed protein product [Vitrella brassicaformis CCMP3155]|mmetsp:Transcript_3909/g.8928  ORF Transcript_3909/g.8928 Transcript_3909/m.8928 type:complete len:413 (+) Transcript_3909:118-1356(+)|eukprot:CEM39086.1 unnamed protein product [Vitrella brassicaformis CCMP3155]
MKMAAAEKNTKSGTEPSNGGTGGHVEMVVFSIAFYCAVSLCIVFLNYTIFTDTLPYPVFVSWFQQAMGLVVFVAIGWIGQFVPSLAFWKPYSFKWHLAVRVLPLTVVFVAMIGFSNTCLKHVQVSTYQVARSLTIVFNIVLSYVILGQRSSLMTIVACLVVVSGFIVGSLDPSTLSLMGILTGSMASFFQAIYMVQIKNVLRHVDGDQNVLMSYNLTLSAVLFVPVIFIAQEEKFYEALPFELTWDAANVWGSLCASGILSVLIAIASYLCVKHTSPLTFNVVGYAKACLQSIGGIIFFADMVTPKSLLGICLTLGGSIGYGQVKFAERQAAMRASSSTTSKDKEGGMSTPLTDISTEAGSDQEGSLRNKGSNTTTSTGSSNGGSEPSTSPLLATGKNKPRNGRNNNGDSNV